MRLLSEFEDLAGDDLNLQRRLRQAFWRRASLAEAHAIVGAWRAGDRRAYSAPTDEEARMREAYGLGRRIAAGLAGEEDLEGLAPEVRRARAEGAALARRLIGEDDSAPLSPEARALVDLARRTLFGEDGEETTETPAPTPEARALADLAIRVLFGEEGDDDGHEARDPLPPAARALADEAARALFGPADDEGGQ